MIHEIKNVLLIGFNTRPLACSLRRAGYDVHAVDFFGDLDLYPCVKDCLIVLKQLRSNYKTAKDIYGRFLAEFALRFLKKYSNIDYLIIGSGLDDGFKERSLISNEMKDYEYPIIDANNKIEIMIKSRNIEYIHDILKKAGYKIPSSMSLENILQDPSILKFPVILKKTTSSGGLNIFKLKNFPDFMLTLKIFENQDEKFHNWVVQEFIEGIPISCTTISNGCETEVISINRQIIGEKFLYSPKEFMYCGNVVPAYILKNHEKLVSEISLFLANNLGLKGINGFDYVLKNNYPYIMEINPRIPGSINASELALNMNLLDLHLKSFDSSLWHDIKNALKSHKYACYSTKIILFSPKELNYEMIEKINKIEHVHDKNDPNIPISKGAPICTVLYGAGTFSDSYFGALKIVDKIKQIIA